MRAILIAVMIYAVGVGVSVGIDTDKQRGWDCGNDNNCKTKYGPGYRNCIACCSDYCCGSRELGCEDYCDGDPRPGDDEPLEPIAY